jgi:hydrogenase nickel incorporation protein HypA/HybF
MHELTIANRLIDRAVAVAHDHDADRVDRLTVALGEATHVAADQLQFCLAAAAEGTPAQGATVDVECVAPEGRCDCGWSGQPGRIDATVAAPDRRCPDCKERIELTAGDDCRLTSIQTP